VCVCALLNTPFQTCESYTHIPACSKKRAENFTQANNFNILRDKSKLRLMQKDEFQLYSIMHISFHLQVYSALFFNEDSHHFYFVLLSFTIIY